MKERCDQLPLKAIDENPTAVYWVSLPSHINFTRQEVELRKKWNDTLESVLKLFPNMRMIRFKDKWDPSNINLIHDGRLTFEGRDAYFSVLDSSLKFNLLKCKEYTSRLAARASQPVQATATTKGVVKHGGKGVQHQHHPDEIPHFFRKHPNDKFHWSKNGQRKEDRNTSRFLMPRVK